MRGRLIAALVFGAACLPTQAAFESDGAWKAGSWASTSWADGAWYEAGGDVAVPNVIGQANSAAADMILEGDGLDLGAVTERCSDAADDEVVGQDPAPGVLVDLASLVDVLVSNGVECPSGSPGGKGVTLPGLSIGL